jgi:orotate phosphoribosyltransferase
METAKTCASYLLAIEAVKLSPTKPFTWASGLKSPIYCDNRKTLSFPDIRTFIRNGMIAMIKTYYPKVELIAGVATGAIAHGVLVAERLGLPFVYVRSEEKKHGLTNIVEGVVAPGQRVVVVEDLISTGQSSLKVAQTLKEMQCEVFGMLAIFSYNLSIATQRFAAANLALHTLTNYAMLIETAAAEGYVSEAEMETLNKWSQDPAAWAAKWK